MGANSEKFLQLRAEEMANLYPQDFTKKEAISTGVKMVTDLLESGEVDKLQFMSNLCRLKEVINSADAEMRKHLPNEKSKVYGVEFTPVDGGNTYNFKEDPIWCDIQKELKDREELIKVAVKSQKEVYDEAGIEVTKVSLTPRKSSITIKF